jgi:Family of unknown function (DUF6204)
MADRTYRVTVRGRFDGLDDPTRARLRGEAAEHDVLVATFTDEGTLTYDQRLDAFQHRLVVRVEEGTGEEDVARTAGELAATEYLEAAGLGYRNLRSTATCMDDVKVRRR